MLQVSRFRSILLSTAVMGLTTLSAASDIRADQNYLGVVTIYNKSNVQLEYQLRAKKDGVWSDWKSHTHRHPNSGYQYHSYYDADAIQIRFDRIGGDGEFTEKIYDLEFNRVSPDVTLCKHKGRPYKFEFDRGGRLLDLYRYGW